MDWQLPERARKGRGAVSNRVGRFETTDRFAIDDGWSLESDEPDRGVPPLSVDSTRTVIARNDSGRSV